MKVKLFKYKISVLSIRKLSSFIVIVTFFLLFQLFAKHSFAQEKSDVLIINQIRGSEECCHPGSAEMLDKIGEWSEEKEIPISWALRFDALTNDAFVEKTRKLPDKHMFGVLLEITPGLAESSGVAFKGKEDGSDWFNAQNVFLIGYSQNERKKLIDTVFAKYKEIFGTYPTFTVSWMIDAWSLNYINQEYGVILHEITKEQFGTDSYTLYGGWFNAPYIPSINHPLVPAKNPSSGLDMVMVRQTISDIEKNYGSGYTYFTSQPNDYLSNPDTREFEYFKHLVDQSKAQDGQSTMVIGLENSQEWQQYRDEYVRQLDYLYELAKNEEIDIVIPEEVYAKQKEKGNESVVLKSPDFPSSGVLWYMNTNYRSRIEIIHDRPVLTDLRIYTTSIDPYKDNAAQKSRAYWVVPYVFDGSQMYEEVGVQDINLQGHPVRSDSGVNSFGVLLAQEPVEKFSEDGSWIILETTSSKITLTEKNIHGNSPDAYFTNPVGISSKNLLSENTDKYFIFPKHLRFFLEPEKNKRQITLGWETKEIEKINTATIRFDEGGWVLEPIEIGRAAEKMLDSLLSPDKSTLPLDFSKSVFYWNNTKAIVSRNPVRLYVSPHNVIGRSTSLESLVVKVDNEDIQISVPDRTEKLIEPFFVDFVSSSKAEGVVSIIINGEKYEIETRIRFITDCRSSIGTCVKDFSEFKEYMKIILKELFQVLETKLVLVITVLFERLDVMVRSVSLPKLPTEIERFVEIR